MRRHNITITIDYETWQPIPKGMRIDWHKDMIEGAKQLMDCCDSSGAKLTFMVEVCELFWLDEYVPRHALEVEENLREIVSRGHDVQLHVHPNWMPETGARFENGKYDWDWDIASCHDYPGDLAQLVLRGKERLEKVIRTVRPDYRVSAFRAGGYRVQPFQRLSKALLATDIRIDTSVYKGGLSKERGYNFSKCKSYNMPYYASEMDPQYEDPKSMMIELPLTAFRSNQRWFLDNDEGKRFAKRFCNFSSQFFEHEENYFVLMGHSKGEHRLKDIEQQLKALEAYPGVRFLTLSDAATEIQRNMPFRKAQQSMEEVQSVMRHIYKMIQPKDGAFDGDMTNYLFRREALCGGYSYVLFHVLQQYGYDAKRVTLFAKNMPNGRGPKFQDTHEVVELTFKERKYVLDQMTGKIHAHSIKELICNPELADYDNSQADTRYKERGYGHYDTGFFYKRVEKYYKFGLMKLTRFPENLLLQTFRCLSNLFRTKLHLLKCKSYLFRCQLKHAIKRGVNGEGCAF